MAAEAHRSFYLQWQSEVLRYARGAGRALRLRGPLAANVTAQVLNTLLVAVLCFCVFDVSVIIPLFALHKLTSTAQASSVGLLFASVLTLLYRGSLRAAGLVYLSGIWLLATLVIVLNAGIHSPFVVLYVAIPISAAWLMGYWAAILSAVICLTSSLVLVLLELSGLPMPHYLPGRPFGTWATIVVAMIIAAVPVAHVLKILNEALTQSESAQEALRESEERFRHMANTAPVMIVTSGPERAADFFNQRWLNFTGRTLDQELGSGWVAGVHPDDVDDCLTSLAATFEARKECNLEYRLRRADGEYRSIICSGVPRFTPNGVFEGYIGSCFDITDVKRALEGSLAREKLESIGVLAAGIAHDFNNLLGGILAEAELAETEVPTESEAIVDIQKIKVLSNRAAEIVRQLMVYASNETSDLESIDLSRLVEEMLDLLRASIPKRVSFKTNLGRDLPLVCSNAAQIRQVAMNLIINAAEAVGSGEGVITVTVSRFAAEEGQLSGIGTDLPGRDYVRLEVSDTGPGITEEARLKIFDPFFTTKFVGRGLGLAVVQGIVRAHHGEIRVVSTPGRGATFQIFLPCVPRAQGADRTSVASAAERAFPSVRATRNATG